MSKETISLNKKFKELLQCIQGNEIKRKTLIDTAASLFDMPPRAAEAFVARNVHSVQKYKLIEASGERGERTYHLTSSLVAMVKNHTKSSSEIGSSEKVLTTPSLLQEEAKTSAELKMLLGEIETYKEFLDKYPSKRQLIKSLLNKAKDESTKVYGRLNALNKLIQATTQKEAIEC